MMNWKKELLLKRRTHSMTTIQKNEDEDECGKAEAMDSVAAYFRRQLSLLFKIRSCQQKDFNGVTYNEIEPTEKIENIEIPTLLIGKDDDKTIKVLYRRISRMFMAFEQKLEVEEKIAKIVEREINSEKPSMKTFYDSVKECILSEIIKQKRLLVRKRRTSKRLQQKLKKSTFVKIPPLTFKQLNVYLINLLYSIIEVEKIEALECFIEGVDVKDNINLLYGRQKPRNKRIKKQIKMYSEQYTKKVTNKHRCFSEGSNNKENKLKSALHKTESQKSKQSLHTLPHGKKRVQNRNRVILQPLNANNHRKLKIMR